MTVARPSSAYGARRRPVRRFAPGGFTLLELLVVLAILGILAGALTVAMNQGLEAARDAACKSNLRQLFLANFQHALDTGFYAPAASDLFDANLNRWHGSRASLSDPFDGTDGPLSPYLGASGHIRSCRSLRQPVRGADANAFEASCGGYGYNASGVGSETYILGMRGEAMKRGMAPEAIMDPARTVMFSDSAFPQPYGNNPAYLIEYSFAEAYHWVFDPGVESPYRADPSIHFRHRGRANVVWCDGRVSSERLTTEAEPHFTRWRIGWFGPPNNSLFDPR